MRTLVSLDRRKSADKLCSAIRQGDIATVDKLMAAKPQLLFAEAGYGEWPLFGAVVTGRMEIVQKLLAAGAPVNAVRYDGETALHAAATMGHLELISLLLDDGADLRVRNDYGWTPLLAAGAHKKREAIARLLDGGADIDARSREGESVLTMCARTGCLEIAEDLVARGAKASDAELLFLEVLYGDAAAVKRRMERNPRLARLQNGRFTAPLHYAVERSDSAVVQALLDHGMPVDVGLGTYMSPLHWASGKNLLEMVELLLARGAQINGRAEGGMTPLHKAASFAEAALVRLLLDRGAEIDPTDRMEMTPLAWAMNYKNHATIQMLLERGADLYHQCDDDETLLERGMRSEDDKIIAMMWEFR